MLYIDLVRMHIITVSVTFLQLSTAFNDFKEGFVITELEKNFFFKLSEKQ